MAHPLSATEDPQPSPWRGAAAYILSALTVKDAAQKLGDAQLKSNILRQVDSSIDQFLDDYCGTPPRPRPWPWPGPVPSIFPLVSELTFIANTLAAGALRTSLEQVSAKALEKGFAGVSKAD
jgi:hypothetical protein